MEDQDAEPFRFADELVIDVAVAVEVHQPAKAALAGDNRPPKFKRTMARTATLLAHPVKECGSEQGS